ncbi:MAG: flagellar biosynthesis protein FlhA [Spirochaetes bacterium]|nr:flagellar biosynthesis protein FlhA [Spirochaetota bacterium]
MADVKKPLTVHWMQQTDILMAIGVVAIILMLIIPLPSLLLDMLIAISLMLGIVVLLTVMYIQRATDFSVFPSLLLITTVFRLALNVSSTRLILLKGPAFNVQIIKAFGNFVVGGNYVVGFIIFLILVAVQFIVITKGATRISEVAARFTLDALPGKQMSIDADLNAGLITEEEAIKRRLEIRRESDFYGAMDGAAKFVQGDVKVGLIITVINIIGGLIIGTVMRGETISSSLKIYSLLTVGDGLVAQIPALLISTATGIIVTRAVSDGSLGEDLAKQVTNQPRAIFIGSVFLFLIAFVPGFPTIPLILLSIVTSVVGYQIYQIRRDEKKKIEGMEKEKEEEKRKPLSLKGLLQVDPLEVEIGYSLIPLVDPEQGGDLLERITMIRRQAALEMGLLVPPIRIRDNMKLEPDEYNILVKGVEVAKGKLRIGKFLAMDSTGKAEKIEGEKTQDPAFGLPAYWIDTSEKDKVELRGYTVVDLPSVIATHLTEMIKKYSYEILGRKEVQELLENVKEVNPVLIEEVNSSASIGIVQKVLQNLLRERISIRDLNTILESIADYAPTIKNIDYLTEYVRSSLKRQITRAFVSEEGKIPVVTVDPDLENVIHESLQETSEGISVGLPPDTIEKIIRKASDISQNISRNGNPLIIMTNPNIRPILFDILERAIHNLVVLSYNEVEPNIFIENLSVLEI